MSNEQASGMKDEGGRMKAEALRAEVCRLHAARGPLVSAARAARMEHGVTSAEFVQAWSDVERVTRDLEAAEAELAKADAEDGGRKAEAGEGSSKVLKCGSALVGKAVRV